MPNARGTDAFTGYRRSRQPPEPLAGGPGTVSCNLGTMATAASATIGLVVKDTAPSGSVIKDTAKVKSSTPDPVSSNNSVTFGTKVQ